MPEIRLVRPSRPAAPMKPAPDAPPIKRKAMTLAEAADYYATEQSLKPLFKEAREVLLAYFERTGRAAYKDRIGWRWSGGALVLDQAKVRDFLGDRLAAFQTRARRSRSLTLLKP